MTKISVSEQNQTTEDLFKNLPTQISYDFAALNWLLLVTKSSNWGTTIKKTEIGKLKIENWCIIVFIDVRIVVWC